MMSESASNNWSSEWRRYRWNKISHELTVVKAEWGDIALVSLLMDMFEMFLNKKLEMNEQKQKDGYQFLISM